MLGLITWYPRESMCGTWAVCCPAASHLMRLHACLFLHWSVSSVQTCPSLRENHLASYFFELHSSLSVSNFSKRCIYDAVSPHPTSSMTSLLLGPGHFTFCPLLPPFWAVLSVTPEELTPVQSPSSLGSVFGGSCHRCPDCCLTSLASLIFPFVLSFPTVLTSPYAQAWSPSENNNICFKITSPGWMHETSAQGWCTGKTQRNGMEKEAGGGIGMGNTCKSMADSCQCMAKPITIFESNQPPTNKNKWKEK